MNIWQMLLIRGGYCAEQAEDGGAPAAAPAEPSVEAKPDAQPGNILNDGKPDDQANDGKPPVQPDWRQDWRDKLAAGDDKFRKQLERYASPETFAKAHRELQAKIGAGELKSKLPEKPTDEELAHWRKENNVPDKASDYINDLPSGIVIGDEDKPRVESFLAAMHGKNVPKDIVQAAVEWNQTQIEEEAQQRYDRNAEMQEQTEEALRQEWGQDYRRNTNLARNLIATLPEGAREAFASASTADGTAIFNNPDVVRWMVDLARKVNPVGTVVPGATNPSAITDEITQLETKMKTDREAWFKDSKSQERLQELYKAQEQLG